MSLSFYYYTHSGEGRSRPASAGNFPATPVPVCSGLICGLMIKVGSVVQCALNRPTSLASTAAKLELVSLTRWVWKIAAGFCSFLLFVHTIRVKGRCDWRTFLPSFAFECLGCIPYPHSSSLLIPHATCDNEVRSPASSPISPTHSLTSRMQVRAAIAKLADQGLVLLLHLI